MLRPRNNREFLKNYQKENQISNLRQNVRSVLSSAYTGFSLICLIYSHALVHSIIFQIQKGFPSDTLCTTYVYYVWYIMFIFTNFNPLLYVSFESNK